MNRRAAPTVTSFAVYSLSRGAGVPAPAREAFAEVERLVRADQESGIRVRIEKSRLGLEGESRLCADYEDARDGTRAYERAQTIVKDVELVNLVVEPCPSGEPS